MLQKEVIESHGGAASTAADFGRLSVMLQWRYAMENVLFVPPEMLRSAARVDSAVVRMVPLAQPPVLDVGLFSRNGAGVRSASAASCCATHLGPLAGAEVVLQVQFDVQRRAQEVPVEEYCGFGAIAEGLKYPLQCACSWEPYERRPVAGRPFALPRPY